MDQPGRIRTLPSEHRSVLDGSRVVAVQVTKKVGAEGFPFRREIGTLLGRVRSGLAREAALVLHVTSAVPGEGVSTVARELVHAAAAMPWCRPLLIDRNPGPNDQSAWFGLKLPNLLGIYDKDGHLSTAAIEVAGTTFHAAQISPDVIMDAEPGHLAKRLAALDEPVGDQDPASTPAGGRGYEPRRLTYDLVVVDCPPVLSSSHFLLLTQRAAEVLLVVRAERTRLSAINEAKERLASARCEISGVVLNQWRRVPSLFGGVP